MDYYKESLGPSWQANYDADKIPPYTLPDVLQNPDGSFIQTKEEWLTKRRPYLIQTFRELMYGKEIPKPDHVSYELLAEKRILDGKGIRREIKMTFSMNDNRSRSVIMLLYLPATSAKHPVFVGLTFDGNHVVEADPDITPTGHQIPEGNHCRGACSRRFPIEQIIDRGYALAVSSYHDFFLDNVSGWKESIYTLFFSQEELSSRLPDYTAIGAWSWGNSRMLDYLETVPEIDADKAIVYGHSRLGKTALWTGARDERFKLACVNDSGHGGAALNRRLFGETLYSMMGHVNPFSFWFCDKLNEYAATPEKMPIDQHELIALVAPRAVAVHSATLDLWADPDSEFLSAYHAGPVFRLFGLDTIKDIVPPPAETPVGGHLSYFKRTGEHDILAADFSHYMDCADMIFGR